MLTHEDAPLSDQMPYIGSILQPLKPRVFLGRSAKKEPICQPRHAVYKWFQDARRHAYLGVLFMTAEPGAGALIDRASVLKGRAWCRPLFRHTGCLQMTGR